MSVLVDLVHQACREHRVLRISYLSEAEDTTHLDLEIYWASHWMIDAICRPWRDLHHIRIDRILSAELLPESFERSLEIAILLKYSSYAEDVDLEHSFPHPSEPSGEGLV